MTHTVIRLAELAEDATAPIGYAPTGNQLLLTGSDAKPLGGRVFTAPIVRERGDPEGSGAPATPHQLTALHNEETGVIASGLVVERVHAEVQLAADLDTLRWLLTVRGQVISVDVWQGTQDVMEAPAWHHSTIQLVRLRDVFTTFTGDVIKHDIEVERGDGDGYVASTWYQHRRWTTTPPPSPQDDRV